MIIVPIKKISNKLAFRFFDCGNVDLNLYLQQFAYANDVVGMSKTFICLDDERKSIIGYYTLCASCVMSINMPANIRKRLPKYPCPCAKIARLAVDLRFQKQHFGKELLKDAIKRIITASNSIGIYGILVDAKDEAQSFYEHYSFIRLKKDSSEYLLPIVTAIKALQLSEPTNKSTNNSK